MRLVAGALALALLAPIARADDTTISEPARSVRPAEDPAHSKIPLRVVRVMPESHQALLFDQTRATHVLAEIGGRLDGYTVEDIDDDTVTLSRDDKQVVLIAPPRASHRRDRDAVHVRSAAAGPSDTAEPAPIDPYGDAPIRVVEAPGAAYPAGVPPAGPTTTETREAGIRVVQAPDVPAPLPVMAGEGGIRVAEAPGAAPALRVPARAPAAAAPTSGSPAAAPVAAGATPGPGHVPASGGATPGFPREFPRTVPAAGAASSGASRIRVVTAPSGLTSDAPAPPTPIRVAEVPVAVPSTATGGGATAPAPISAAQPSAAAPSPTALAAPVHPARAASPSDPHPGGSVSGSPRSDPRGADAARAPDKQTLDARALADIMTTDGRTRSPRPLPTAPSAIAAAHPVTAAHPVAATPAMPADARPGEVVMISRGELDRALADFAGLTAAVRGSFSASGVTVESVGDGTIFQRAGLRAGDVITSVDGAPLHSLDDAANLYARASTARAMTAQIVRGGKPVALHVVIH